MLCVQVPRVEVYRALFRNPGAAYESVNLHFLLQQIRKVIDIPLIATEELCTDAILPRCL
ncbi:hypothetical protein [Saccharococcus caldoxylosilyticus]|uniref:hypothetical protein n=1 Tax=Saccharococcus caldoxylosilyticus TaxID=81408 RepID=UPI0002E48D3C|nr:hypothetical protein [Parageobacillus caldoxylosilyticus]